MQRAVVHAVVLISRRSRSLVPHSWMSIVHILIFWSDRAHTAALWRSECTWIMLDFKAGTNSCLIGLHGRDLYHRCLHLAARCLIAQCVSLHFLSWYICSHPDPRQSVRTVPACLPVCLQTRAQAQFILWRPRGQMFTIVPLLGLKTPLVRGADGWKAQRS